MSSGESFVLILFAAGCLFVAYKCFAALFLIKKAERKYDEAVKKGEVVDRIVVIEPEESEAERQFREYGDYYGYSYYGDDDK